MWNNFKINVNFKNDLKYNTVTTNTRFDFIDLES